MESPGSSARVIQETPNSHSDQSSVSYKDWKQSSPVTAHSPLPRGTYRCRRGALYLHCFCPLHERELILHLTGAIDFSTPAQSLSAWPSANALQTPPMPSAECFNETPPQSDMPLNWQAAHEDIGSFTPLGLVRNLLRLPCISLCLQQLCKGYYRSTAFSCRQSVGLHPVCSRLDTILAT